MSILIINHITTHLLLINSLFYYFWILFLRIILISITYYYYYCSSSICFIPSTACYCMLLFLAILPVATFAFHPRYSTQGYELRWLACVPVNKINSVFVLVVLLSQTFIALQFKNSLHGKVLISSCFMLLFLLNSLVCTILKIMHYILMIKTCFI